MNKLAFLLASLKASASTKTKITHAPLTALNIRACTILEDLGYIQGFTVLKNKKIKIFLRFFRNKSVLRTASLVSRPSSRVYLSYKNLKGKGLNTFISNYSFIIISTSQNNNLLTDVEAFLLRTGGEALFVIS